MTYIQTIDYLPSLSNLTEAEAEFFHRHVEIQATDLIVDHQSIRWDLIEEIEVVAAPRAAGPGGWIVRKFFLNDEERFHVGIYFGRQEAILPNIPWDSARYIVEIIAYYAPNRVRYKGLEDLVALTEI